MAGCYGRDRADWTAARRRGFADVGDGGFVDDVEAKDILE